MTDLAPVFQVPAEMPDRDQARDQAREEARELTDRIRASVEQVWSLVIQAYQDRVWEALDYPSWRRYCEAEFGSSRLRPPPAERPAVVARLTAEGLSTRAIAAATGLSRTTVARSRAGVPNGTPAVTGLDGKSYPPGPAATAQKATDHDTSPSGPVPIRVPARRPPADQVIPNLVSGLRGMCQVLETYELDPDLDRAQADAWARDLAPSLTVLRRLNTTLKEYSRAN